MYIREKNWGEIGDGETGMAEVEAEVVTDRSVDADCVSRYLTQPRHSATGSYL